MKDKQLDALLKAALVPDGSPPPDMGRVLAFAKRRGAQSSAQDKRRLEICLSAGILVLAVLELVAIGCLTQVLPSQASFSISAALAAMEAVTLLGAAIAALVVMRRSAPVNATSYTT